MKTRRIAFWSVCLLTALAFWGWLLSPVYAESQLTHEFALNYPIPAHVVNCKAAEQGGELLHEHTYSANGSSVTTKYVSNGMDIYKSKRIILFGETNDEIVSVDYFCEKARARLSGKPIN